MFFSLISRRNKSHWLKFCSVELKTALQKFIGLITSVSNIFVSIIISDTIIAFIIKVLYRIQQRLMHFNSSVFTSTLKPSPCRVYYFYCWLWKSSCQILSAAYMLMVFFFPSAKTKILDIVLFLSFCSWKYNISTANCHCGSNGLAYGNKLI